ncbi:MAG: efflux RND transporter permease subunit, partial [Pseudomonadota bacterium]
MLRRQATLDVRVISVRTDWPGATPQDVEKEINIEQEDFLRNLPNLSRITATASNGRAEIELEFPFGTDITEMMIRVNNALSQVPSYPENVDEPRIFANSFSSNAFMFFSIVALPGNPRQLNLEMTLDFIEDNVKPRLAGVPGVSEISVFGGAERQVQILVDPARLAQRGLTLVDLRDAIRSRNLDRSGGTIESGKRQYLLRTVGRFESIEEVGELIIERRGDTVIRLSEVADIQLDHFERTGMSRFNGSPNIFMSVRREPGSNVIDIKRNVLQEIEAVNRDLLGPAGMEMMRISDDVTYVNASIRNVWKNLFIGALLATIVMYLFLRSAKATLLGVVGIPLCVIVAFLGLLIAGRTINVISLAGIAFAIGMTLDNSIVVLESIELERRRGADRLKAALDGVKQVWPAVFASTMTTILVFLPVSFVAQEAGQLYSDVAIAISAAILASLLAAITIVPAAAARLDFTGAVAASRDPTANKASRSRVWRDKTLAMTRTMIATPANRYLCIGVTAAVSIAIIWLLTPAAEYLPEGEEPKVFAVMTPPPGYNLQAMDEISQEIDAWFLPQVNADPGAFDSGKTDVPPIRYVNLFFDTSRLRIITEPVRAGDMNALMDAIVRKYHEYPGMRAFAARGSIISSNDGGSRSINLDIAGPNMSNIYDVALAAYRRAEEVFDNPRIQSQPGSLSLAQPLVEVRPRWERAAELGMNAESLGFTVAALTDGSFVDEFFLEDDKIDIYIYSEVGARKCTLRRPVRSKNRSHLWTKLDIVSPSNSPLNYPGLS